MRLQVYSVCCPPLPDAARDLCKVLRPSSTVQTPEAACFQYLLVLGRLTLAEAVEVTWTSRFLITAGLLTYPCLHFHKLPVNIFFFCLSPIDL